MLKIPPRQLRNGLQKQTQKQAQEKYFINTVTRHAQYRLILQSLREGITPKAIASHFAEQGWLSVNERTFTEAIRTFRAKNPGLIETLEGEGLDAHIEPNRPSVDIRQQLQQLLRLQRVRLGMAHAFEKEANIPSSTLHKEIEATRALIETIGKLDGKITDGVGRRATMEEPDVLENLNRVKKDQITRDRLHTQVAQLAKTQTA